MATSLTGHLAESQPLEIQDPSLSPQRLHKIFQAAVVIWPTGAGYACSYGELRSGFNAGTVLVDFVEHAVVPPGMLAYNVTFEGVTQCVLIDP